jgi:hypothetical protein
MAVGAGYSGTPLPRKLGIGDGHVVAWLGAPPDFERLLEPLPPGVRLRRDLRAKGPYDVIVVFVRSESELRSRFDRAKAKLHPDGGLWVSWPKRSSDLATALKESHVRQYGLSTGLVDNKACAIDRDWSGLRFVRRRSARPLPGPGR